jgi:hypothetical protein
VPAQGYLVKEISRASIVEGLFEAQLAIEMVLQLHHIGANEAKLSDQLAENRDIIVLWNHQQTPLLADWSLRS